MKLSQDDLYGLTKAAAWGCWALAVTGSVLRSLNLLPLSAAMFVVVIMGGGIFFSLSLSRFRLTNAIRDVFLAGLGAATSLAGRTENQLRDLHCPTKLRDDSPAEVCSECAQRYPCKTIRTLDGEEALVLTEHALHP